MKLKYILPILIGAFSFTSCNDFLDREPLFRFLILSKFHGSSPRLENDSFTRHSPGTQRLLKEPVT